MDEYAVLVFRDQPFTDEEQLAFAAALRRRAARQDRRRGAGQEPLRQRGADRHLERRRGRRDHAAGRPPPHVRARQPPLAHRRLVPGPAGPLLDAVRARRAAGRAPTPSSPTCARPTTRSTRDTKAQHRGPARAPLDRLLAADARLRVLGGGAGQAARAPCIRWCASTRAPAAARSTSPRTPRASIDWPVPEGRLLLRDLIEHATQPRVRLSPRVARRRPRHLGQPRHHAPRRRPFDDTSAPPRAAPRDHARPAAAGLSAARSACRRGTRA